MSDRDDSQKSGLSRILLVGNAPYANRGCEAIVRGTVEVFSQRFPDVSFILSSRGNTVRDDAKAETDPRIDHRPPRGTSIKRFSLPWWKYKVLLRSHPELLPKYIHSVQLKAMEECDCALEIGGDNYGLAYGIPSLFIDMDRSLMATGKPVAIWGASIGPFTANPEIEQVMQKHLRSLSLICARETETLAYLSSIGVEENVRLVADPAFMMTPEEPQLTDEIARFIERRPIGLNFSPLAGKYRETGGDWDAILTESIRLLANEFGPILFVPHVFAEGQNDYEFMSKLISGLDDYRDRLAILPPTLSAAQYKWVISRLRAFAGARTHSTIAALSTSVPTLSIGYSMKARGINKDIFGHTDWVISVSDITPNAFIEKMRSMISCEDEVRAYLNETIPGVKECALKAADYMAELIMPG